MSWLGRIFGREAKSVVEPSVDEAFGAELDEHSHLIIAGWTDTQRAEYLGYGLEALLACRAFEEGRFLDANHRFTTLLAESDAPVHLLRDAGRAKLFCGEREEAEALFERFLEAGDGTISEDQRFLTHVDLATIADERGEVDRAIEWLSAVIGRNDDPRTYLALGRYLRREGFVDEALDVYRGYLDHEETPISAILEEAGLCHLARGDLPIAERHLGEVVRRARCSCGAKVPESTAAALASIYESTGRHAEAAEILRSVGNACRS